LSGDMGVAIEGSNASIPGDDQSHPNSADFLRFPPMNPYTRPRWFEIYAQGTRGFEFDVSAEPFVRLSQNSGSIWPDRNTTDIRILISIDWKACPNDSGVTRINITSSTEYGTQYSQPYILVPYNNTHVPTTFLDGFVESDGAVSMEAEHYTRNVSQSSSLAYYTIPHYGKTLSGVALTDRNAPPLSPSTASYLDYDFFTFTEAIIKSANISLILGLSLNTNPHRPLRYAIAIDGGSPKTVQYVIEKPKSAKSLEWPNGMPFGWEKAVVDAAWVSVTNFTFKAGKHTLRFWALEPGVVLQKVVIDLGGVRRSYLGPPESWRVGSQSVPGRVVPLSGSLNK
jgi:hypothetical protein